MSNDNEPTTFEEAYERYIEYRTRFERLETEFDEYQQSSLNYEQELEVQLKQLDSQAHRVQHDLFVERTQNEQYRERTEQISKQYEKRFDQLQEELNSCKNLNEKLTSYIRELEQTNDDLERSNRTLLDSLSTFETKLNRALEQNALLENELDEKQQLTETVQRLRDETRELREELNVLHQNNKERANSETPVVNSDRMKSILSEAAVSNTTMIRDSNSSQDYLNGDSNTSISSNEPKNSPSTPKHPTLLSTTKNELNKIISTSTDSQIVNGNDFYQPLSTSTRLESLRLISQALHRFSTIESTLLTHRKQSQMTSSTNQTRSRFNTTATTHYNKANESIVTHTYL